MDTFKPKKREYEKCHTTQTLEEGEGEVKEKEAEFPHNLEHGFLEDAENATTLVAEASLMVMERYGVNPIA